MSDEEKRELLELLAAGNISGVISRMSTCRLSESKKHELVAIASRYQRLKRKERLGILSFENINLNENQISSQLVELIRWPEHEPFPEASSKLQNRSQPIYWKYVSVLGVIVGIVAGVIEILDYFNNQSHPNHMVLRATAIDDGGNPVADSIGRFSAVTKSHSSAGEVGSDGILYFPGIHFQNKGESFTISLHSEDWELEDRNKTYIFDGRPVEVNVRLKQGLGLVQGAVKSRDGQKAIENAKVFIDSDTTVYTDTNGFFEISLPRKMTVKSAREHYEITVSKSGYKTATYYHYPKTKSEIRLENQ